MTAQPMRLPPRPTASRRLITGAIVLVIAVLSLWLLIAAGLQAARPSDSSVPSLLPEAPAVVDVAQPAAVGDAEPVPQPGPAIVPANSGRSPR